MAISYIKNLRCQDLAFIEKEASWINERGCPGSIFSSSETLTVTIDERYKILAFPMEFGH